MIVTLPYKEAVLAIQLSCLQLHLQPTGFDHTRRLQNSPDKNRAASVKKHFANSPHERDRTPAPMKIETIYKSGSSLPLLHLLEANKECELLTDTLHMTSPN